MICPSCIKCALSKYHDKIKPIVIHDMLNNPIQGSIPSFKLTIQCGAITAADFSYTMHLVPCIDHEGNAAAMIYGPQEYRNIVSVMELELFFKNYCDKIDIRHLLKVFETCVKYHGYIINMYRREAYRSEERLVI